MLNAKKIRKIRDKVNRDIAVAKWNEVSKSIESLIVNSATNGEDSVEIRLNDLEDFDTSWIDDINILSYVKQRLEKRGYEVHILKATNIKIIGVRICWHQK